MGVYSFLILISEIILLYLSFYALSFFIIAFTSLKKIKNKKNDETGQKAESLANSSVNSQIKEPKVAVLVPVCNEGEIILDCMNSLKAQKYKNFEIIIALGSKEDTSFKFIKNFLGNAKETKTEFGSVFIKDNLKVLVQDYEKGKSKKLNDAFKLTDAKVIALLDADHKALPDWLSTGVKYFEKNVGIVQCRRFSSGSENIISVWDAVQGNIGNEVVNRGFTSMNLNVFFTGTTVLIKKEIMDKFGLSNCITEDTYLSYKTILDDYKIVYCHETGSYEESVNNLNSFIDRKRRWSAGHNFVMLKFFPKIFQLKLKEKIQLFFHSQFFILPLLILIFLMIWAYHYFVQYSLSFSLVSLGISCMLALMISFYFRGGLYNRVSSFIVSLMLFIPLIFTTAIYWMYLTGNVAYYNVLSFPLSLVNPFKYLMIITLIAPFMPVITGLFVLKPKHIYKYVLSIITIPLLFFFDIYGCLLGITDLFLKKEKWVKTKRTGYVVKEEIDKRFEKEIFTKIKKSSDWKILVIILISLILFIGINDSLCKDNCGSADCKLFKPILISPISKLNLSLDIERIENESGINFKVSIIISGKSFPKDLKMTAFLDSKEVKSELLNKNSTIKTSFYLPFGFNKHVIDVKLEGKKVSCNRQEDISDSIIKTEGKQIYVNGEPFLVKGVIPSFSLAKNLISVEEGLSMIKKTGANTLRIYHKATKELIEESKKQGFMIIEQVDQTTWDQIDLNLGFNTEKKFFYNLEKLLKEHKGESNILMINFGNELELKNDLNEVLNFIDKITNKTKDMNIEFPTTYSSFQVMINPPVDVKSVNMLDEGELYWKRAIKIITETNKPALATEFGGFVAFKELPDEKLRAERIKRNWQTLLENGFIGAIIHESHDNWGQSIPVGYNDPTKPDQPDDNRGIYNIENKQKPSFYAVQEIFCDFDYEIEKEFFGREEIIINISNKRNYKLTEAILNYEGTETKLGSFNPFEKKTIILPSPKQDNPELSFYYTTHSGLKSKSTLFLKIKKISEQTKILSDNFLVENQIKTPDSEGLTGKIENNEKIRMLISKQPKKITLNGEITEFNYTSPILEIKPKLKAIVEPKEWEFSVDEKNWINIDKTKMWPSNSKKGFYKYHFNTDSKDVSIKLEGTGGPVKLKINENSIKEETHFYRPNLINLSAYVHVGDNSLIIEFNRDQTIYIQNRLYIEPIPLVIYQKIPVKIEIFY